MTEYKCPYCEQDSYAKSSKKSGKFSDWKAVRNHTSTCVKNTKEYMICLYYGPIKFSYIDKFKSLYEFTKLYPHNTFHSSHWKDIRNTKKLTLRRNYIHTNNSILCDIKSFYTKYGKLPQARDFRLDYRYPNAETVIRSFGSWNKAIEAAGFTANYNDGFGTRTMASDGVLYRSQAEAYFVDHFLFEKEEYEYEKPYGNGWVYDFYLPKHNLYIELDGGLRPQRIEEKRKYHLQHGINCRIIKTQDIYKKDFSIV